MLARALCVMIAMMVTQAGCGESSTGPAPDIDPSIVGSWIHEGRETDSNGDPCRHRASPVDRSNRARSNEPAA